MGYRNVNATIVFDVSKGSGSLFPPYGDPGNTRIDVGEKFTQHGSVIDGEPILPISKGLQCTEGSSTCPVAEIDPNRGGTEKGIPRVSPNIADGQIQVSIAIEITPTIPDYHPRRWDRPSSVVYSFHEHVPIELRSSDGILQGVWIGRGSADLAQSTFVGVGEENDNENVANPVSVHVGDINPH